MDARDSDDYAFSRFSLHRLPLNVHVAHSAIRPVLYKQPWCVTDQHKKDKRDSANMESA
jgi:hypothetical protein